MATYKSIHQWILKEDIKNEKGDPIRFNDHLYLYDIYADNSQYLTILKAAQVGLSTLQILKNHNDAKNQKLDIIYTLPTDNDVRVFVGGKVNRIIANNKSMLEDVADKDSIEQKQVGNSMIYFRGCVDEDTEVLTEKGWCKRNEVFVGDKLPTMNMDGEVEMDEVLGMTSFKTEEEMVRIKSSLIDQLVTKDHRCVIAKRTANGHKSSLRIVRAHEMVGKQSAYIPTRYFISTEGIKPDAFYKVVGWVIGDGSYWTKRDKYKNTIYETERVCIIQSKLCDELEEDLYQAGITYNKKSHGNSWRYELHAEYAKRIRGIIPKKRLTYELVSSMTQSQRYSLHLGLLMSDGDNKKLSTLWQVKNGTCDAFQALLVYLGASSNKSDIPRQKNRYGTQQQERVRIRKNYWTNPTITVEKYKGIAWCPTTRNGTIFIRRNGKVSVTGQTWTKKAAIMVTADRLCHDEKDSSKLDVVSDYQARLQHSKHKQIHTFSHPSLPEIGVHHDWLKSTQKHWFIKCPACNEWQYLSWDIEKPNKMSVDIERQIFICKKCRRQLPNYARKNGQWVSKYPDKEWSGYWVSLLMAPWVSAKDIIDKFKDPNTTDEFFWTKVLGLPYADESSKLSRQSFFQNLTGKPWAPDESQRVVIGIDTGLNIDYVIGNKYGLFYQGDCKDYKELDLLMQRWKKAIAVIDAGGDLIGSRAFAERWPGRVFICYLRGDRMTNELVKWGTGDETGSVQADRNRMIQLEVDEFRKKRIRVHGTESDWYEYWVDWNNLSKIKVLDPDTNQIKGYKWVRSGRDHKALATVFWRVGMMRFSESGMITQGPTDLKPNSYMIEPNKTVRFNPHDFFDKIDEEDYDWRIT